MALNGELKLAALELFDISRVESRERRAREVVKDIGDIAVAQKLPAGVDLNAVLVRELVYGLVDLGLNALGKIKIGIELIFLITHKG